MITQPRIMCWLCQKPVERVRMFYCELRMITVVEAWCHDQKDKCVITDQILAEALNGAEDFQHGVAFQPKEITVYEQRRGLPRL